MVLNNLMLSGWEEKWWCTRSNSIESTKGVRLNHRLVNVYPFRNLSCAYGKHIIAFQFPKIEKKMVTFVQFQTKN